MDNYFYLDYEKLNTFISDKYPVLALMMLLISKPGKWDHVTLAAGTPL
ncbi:MAG: hypothetical protein WC935_03155 [Thermoleophilia bacterium]